MPITWTNHTNNVTFGAGRLFWQGEDANGALNGERLYLGDTPGFTLAMAGDIASVQSSDGPTPEVIATAPQTATRSFEFTCIDVSTGNLARFIVGTESTVSQTATAVVDEAIAAKQGAFYILGQSSTRPLGYYGGVGSVGVNAAGGGAAKTLGTDYELEATQGILKWLVADASIEVDYTPTANSRTRVTSSSTGDQYGELLYLSDNARGDNFALLVPRCLLQGNGQAAMKARANHVQMQFRATADFRSGYAQMYIDGRPA